MKQQWFISYAREDGTDFAIRLHDRLEADDFPCWLDKRDIQPGEPWDDSIEQGLREAVGMLFIATPASVASQNCKDEWSLALSYKIPVIPLLLIECDLPMRLARRQWIDFTGEFDAAIAQLREHLRWRRSPDGELRTLRDQLADWQRELERQPESKRLQNAVQEAQEKIAYKERAINEPEAVREENRRALEVGLRTEFERQEQALRRAREMERQRIVGSAPQGVSEFFKDRVREVADIHNLLLGDNGYRAVSVYGKGGVGKTALACKVLEEFEQDYAHVYGVIYTSARPGLDINLEQIYLNSAAMFGGDTAKKMHADWTNKNLDAAAKIKRLLDHYANDVPNGQRVIILLDNLEEKLDGHGRLIDAELRLFADMFLEAGHSARLLITSREPLAPADSARRHERILPLDEGLPEPDALELLADFNAQNDVGLDDAARDDLKQIARRTRGFPRALEAVIGVLTNDPLLTLPDLLADVELWAVEVTEKLVLRAQSRLDTDEQLVMQALAVFGRPVTEAAVRFLLEVIPGERSLDVGATIRRLARGQYVSVKRATGQLVLHPLDKEANYRQIPRDTTVEIHVVVLEGRAAAYYVTLRRPQDEWKTIDDLAPQLAEFEHRVRAGDYETAAYLIRSIDYDYLLLWGHARKIVELREQLRGKLDDKNLETVNFTHLGHAYSNLSDFRQALECYKKGLQLDQELGNRWNEGISLGSVGSTYWNLGHYNQAIEHQEQALVISREVEDRQGESASLNALALNYDALGKARKAIELYEQSLAIKRESGQQRSLPVILANLGNSHQALGDGAQAQGYYHEALAIDREIGDRRNEGAHLGLLGWSLALLGDDATALEQLDEALAIAREVGDRRWECYHLTSLGKISLGQNDIEQALEHYRAATAIADEIAAPAELSVAYFGLTEVHLHADDLAVALHAIRTARQHESPRDKAGCAALEGVILARNGQTVEARRAFNAALQFADELLSDTAELYRPKYSRGRALAGLALLSDDPGDLWDQAAEAYWAARANCDAVGVLAIERRRLGYLAPLDSAGRLAALLALLAGD